jgi:hypothetical protein
MNLILLILIQNEIIILILMDLIFLNNVFKLLLNNDIKIYLLLQLGLGNYKSLRLSLDYIKSILIFQNFILDLGH